MRKNWTLFQEIWKPVIYFLEILVHIDRVHENAVGEKKVHQSQSTGSRVICKKLTPIIGKNDGKTMAELCLT